MLKKLTLLMLILLSAGACASEPVRIYYSKETAEKTYALADEYYAKEQYEDAAEYYRNYIRYYPDGPMVADAVLRRLECGFKLIYGGDTDGIDIIKEIITDYPQEDFADESLLKLAGYYFSSGEYDTAIIEYSALLDEYPESPWCGTAQLQIGTAYLNLYRGREYDPSPLKQARKNMLMYLAKYKLDDPDKTILVNEKLALINEKEAERDWYASEFYLKRDKTDAARIYLQNIITTYSATSWAEKAAEKLKTIK